jgi:hypothetical protein
MLWTIENMTQIALPVEVSIREITREKTLGDAILLCIKASGQEAKELRLPFNLDKAQLSRWQSGDEGIKWPKLQALMDACGNDAPLLWMAHDRGYDAASLHKRETETEKENRLLREENAALRRVLQGTKV